MRTHPLSTAALSLALAFVAAPTCNPSTPSGDLTWYTTCGDPVCSGYDGPYDGVPLCNGEEEGADCDDEGSRCDFESDCNSVLICAEEDPKDQPGGCPISLRRYKRDVHYLSDTERARAATSLQQIRLATWRYQWDGPDGPSHLGFVIDDIPESPAVAAGGSRVDLYGYTSLAVAAIQAQQAEIAALRQEVAALRAEVAEQER